MVEKSTPSFERVAEELSQPLLGYLKKMTGNAEDADDLLQETLMRIAGGLSSFEQRSSLKNWAYRIATNVAIDFLRKSKKAGIIEFKEVDECADIDEEDRLVLDEMNECVREVIYSLPPDYRAAIVLFNLQGKSIAEIAEICDISISAAKVRIHRGKIRLQEALSNECDFYKSKAGNLRCNRKT